MGMEDSKHKHLRTTMVYTYVLNRGAMGVKSPFIEGEVSFHFKNVNSKRVSLKFR